MGRQGSPLSPEMKKTAVKLKHYFDRTKNDSKEQELTSAEKSAHALDIGIASVRRIMADYNRDPDSFQKEPLPRGRPKRIVCESSQAIARDYIRQANTKGLHITLEMLSEYLKEAVGGQEYSTWTLGRALDRWGFTYGKGTRSAHLKEKDYVVAARRRYLRAKLSNRKGAGAINSEVFLDESYVNKNHSNDFIWYSEEDGPWVQKPTGKGERMIILNAITEDGWVPNAKRTFKSTKKTGDYHGQMNHELFAKWFEEQLLPNIPSESLIIMDNASYHNTLSINSAPTPSCKKERIRTWLDDNGFPLTVDCLKAEMVEALNKIAPTPTYAIDEIAQKHGHKILRTPPYHPELQPIEICWGVVKNEIARNCDFTMVNLIAQMDKAFDKVTGKTCKGIIKKIRKVEDTFWEEDVKLYCGN